MKQRDEPVARPDDGNGQPVTVPVWDRAGKRFEILVSCDRGAIVAVQMPTPLVELDAGSAHALADVLRAKAAEGTRIQTDRIPGKVFDDAHRFDKGGGPI